MKYALHLGADSRILSAWVVISGGSYDGMMLVDALPEGDITDYRYVDGQYVCDRLPQPEPVPAEPTLEERVGALEDTTDDMILLMAELIGG